MNPNLCCNTNTNDRGDSDSDNGITTETSQNDQPSDNRPLEGSIVVFAKCPIPGKSKTRLIPLLGGEGSIRLARCMLSDVLKTIDGCPELNSVRKVLFYAPGTPQGLEIMESILGELGLKTTNNNTNNTHETWHLLPMLASPKPNGDDDLRSHDLGSKLEDALVRVRELDEDSALPLRRRHNGVVFLGMDAPILPLDDIVEGLTGAAVAAPNSIATLCPARDGGYAMLCVPKAADPSATFRNLYWSHPWTGMSQIKALTDQGIFVGVGSVVRDIDEECDVRELCHHLGIVEVKASSPGTPLPNNARNSNGEPTIQTKNLDFPGGRSRASASDCFESVARKPVTSSHPICHFTRRALEEASIGAPY